MKRVTEKQRRIAAAKIVRQMDSSEISNMFFFKAERAADWAAKADDGNRNIYLSMRRKYLDIANAIEAGTPIAISLY